MKAPSVVASYLLAVSLAAVGARQLHDGIDYERYLAEFEKTDAEMKRWKAAYWRNNAWLPSFPRDLSTEEIDEDLRQRIFMSKQDVREAQAANPDAKFSIMTPFSALTKEEFALRIRNVYVYGNSTTKRIDPTPTPKRGTRINTITIVAAPNPVPFYAITVVAQHAKSHPFDDSLIPSPVPGKSRFLASTVDSTTTFPVSPYPTPYTPDMLATTVTVAQSPKAPGAVTPVVLTPLPTPSDSTTVTYPVPQCPPRVPSDGIGVTVVAAPFPGTLTVVATPPVNHPPADLVARTVTVVNVDATPTNLIPSPIPTRKNNDSTTNIFTVPQCPPRVPSDGIGVTVVAAPFPGTLTVVATPPVNHPPPDLVARTVTVVNVDPTPINLSPSPAPSSKNNDSTTNTFPVPPCPPPVPSNGIGVTVVAAPFPKTFTVVASSPGGDGTTITVPVNQLTPISPAMIYQTVIAAGPPNAFPPAEGAMNPPPVPGKSRFLASAGDTAHPTQISRGLADPNQVESRFLRAQSRASSQTHESKKRAGRTVDWSDSRCMRSIQSQGECSSCWAFASVAAVESLQCIRSDEHGIRKYSEQELVECDLRNKGCDGGTAKYAFEYIQQNGLCSAKSYPYTSQNGGLESCSASCSRKETGITGYKKLREGNEAELIETLQSQPVVAVVAAGNAAWKQYTGGILSSCGTSAVDHTVLIVGYDETSFKVRNWWGEEWGEAGHIRLERTSSRSGTCGLLKDMTHPTM